MDTDNVMSTEDVKQFFVQDADLVVVDTEFTSLEFMKSELVEIGLVKLKAKTYEVIGEEDIKIKPTRIETASPKSLEIIGYSQEEWDRDGVSLTEGLQRFLNYTDQCMLVAHNLPADWMVLRRAFEEVGLKENFYYKGLDTFSLAFAKLGGVSSSTGFERYSLGELAKHFGVDEGQKHRAIDDARATAEIFKKLMAL
ncbi:MAG: hypothetical protein COU11_02510 [Candidatus Harrisonbacteria bacterium CG10_big_fil_rev_8_21_14_0_10_49_15]|uniref:Exonuclease domain-containing protein n=1 Tax=Candidatus Harrisonbacteria bacterium CG10_big_fil_rev_8_21_14_0_10_49_15 TaxID=1974587 RepID=A0A2H0UKZ7_9BACT|nr:MAG: hypothetical protein COU11_02510 [Candidatus Harrisonbacteria bacterium CG10_big_fil_rev_8_21_14_0_10_49_15]